MQDVLTAETMGGVMMGVFLLLAILEMALLAGRVFHDETRWRTWSSVAAMPITIGNLAYLKLVGCSLTLIPAVLILMIGVMLNPEGLFEFLEFLTEGIFQFALLAAMGVLFVHLVAYLSLWLKWGAFNAAVGIVVLGCLAFGLIMGTVSAGASMSEGGFDGICMVTSLCVAGSTVVLHIKSGQRLTELAAQ